MTLQYKLRTWLVACLGEETLHSLPDRALRVLEEAVELAQAADIPAEKVVELVQHVYSRPVGRLEQEVAGVLNTVLLTAECIGQDAMHLGSQELTRAWTHIDAIRRKNRQKVQV